MNSECQTPNYILLVKKIIAAAPGLCPLGLLQDSWERAELMASFPAEQGLSSTERDLVAWGHREGNKDEVW